MDLALELKKLRRQGLKKSKKSRSKVIQFRCRLTMSRKAMLEPNSKKWTSSTDSFELEASTVIGHD